MWGEKQYREDRQYSEQRDARSADYSRFLDRA
jgi:hypothetical protein